MRVAMINNVYPPIMAGGAELIVRYLAEGLAARGREVSVLSTCGPDMEPYPREVVGGVEITRFFPPNLYWSWTRKAQPRSKLDTMRWHLKDAWNRDAGARVGVELDRLRPDVVHTHLIDGFSATVWAEARARGIPVVHTAHDYHLLCPRSILLSKDGATPCVRRSLPCQVYGAWHARTLRHVDVFCSPSQFLIDKHLEYGPLPADRRVVPNGVPMPALETAVETSGRTGRPPRAPVDAAVPLALLSMSRLTPEKGIETTLAAMARLPRELPVTLTIAGTGPLEAAARAAAEADPRIRFVGFVAGPEKEALLQTSDVMLAPSTWFEVFGLVILEAQSRGLGVIGSRIGAIPETVADGVTGLLTAPGDADALADAIRRVAASPDLLARFRAAGPKAARAYTLEAMLDRYEAVYGDLRQKARAA